jgi:hypothetical protein
VALAQTLAAEGEETSIPPSTLNPSGQSNLRVTVFETVFR